jgi:hypothetical protein
LSVDAVQLSDTVLPVVTVAVRPVGGDGETSSLPGGGGSFSSGAVHGAAGPGIAPAPFSKIVDSVAGMAGSIHMPRDSAFSARVTSAAARPV